jgi:hypothetical protein
VGQLAELAAAGATHIATDAEPAAELDQARAVLAGLGGR